MNAARSARSGELARLRVRLADADATLLAIRTGEVDAVVVAGKAGPQVFTLEGAERAYRVLIECMNEGALTLTIDHKILYANQCFARMVKSPLERVIGSSFRRFLSAGDRTALRPLMNRTSKFGSKIQARLIANDGSRMPAQISICSLAETGFTRATVSMVVTDMTQARQSEELLRSLTHRVVAAQEAERRLVAFELHDQITQKLCAILPRLAAMANKLPQIEKSSRGEVMKLSGMLGQIVDEVQRIARNLRPSVLDELGLVPSLRSACTEFADRTGVSLKLECKAFTARLPAQVELALYRILQKVLKNVEKFARARHVTVHLTKQDGIVRLSIQDDGIGFDPDQLRARRKKTPDFGLLGMRERAVYVGGDLKVTSGRGGGTQIDVRIPLRPVPRLTETEV